MDGKEATSIYVNRTVFYDNQTTSVSIYKLCMQDCNCVQEVTKESVYGRPPMYEELNYTSH